MNVSLWQCPVRDDGSETKVIVVTLNTERWFDL